MVGLIGNLAKGALSKPKQKKVSPKQLVKDTGDKKELSKPKGSLVPSPSGAIVKIIDVKAPVKKDFVTGGDPALEQMKIINTKTFDIIKALKGQQVAKKKRAKSKKNLFQWMSRKNREEDREEGKGALKIPLVGKIADSAGNLLGAILKTLAILFAGWLTQYLPQIIKAVGKFIAIVVKIVNFVKPIAKFIWDVGKWIAGAGTKLAAMLVGVKPDEALNNNIIQNLNEIQKKFPLIEAAFASFIVFKGLGGIKKLRTPTPGGGFGSKVRKILQPNRVTSGGGSAFNKSRQLTKTRTADVLKRRRFAKMFGNQAAMKRFGGNVPGRVGSKGSSIFGRGLNKGVGRLGLKIFGKGPMKIITKFAKVPIIGPLIVAVTQLLSGQPLGKALFMGVGAGLGGVLGGLLAGALGVGTAGFGAVLAPAIMIMAEGIGAFVGELLYDGFLGKGWGAAGQKLKDTVVGFFKQTGEIIKSVWKWIMGGGLIELGKSVGKGIVYFLNPAGFWWDMAKKLGGVMKAVGEWIGGAMLRFIDNFFKETAIEIPSGGGVRAGLTLAAQTLGLYDWLEGIGYAGGKDGQIDKFPNLLQLYNPFKYVPLLFKSFFPEKAKAMAEKKAAVERGDVAKKNIFGVELSDEHQSEEYLKKRDSGQITSGDSGQIASDSTSQKTEQNASSISHSASYDRVDVQKGGRGSAIIPVPINQMQGGTSGGSGGGASSSGVNKYDVVSDLKKTMVLAKLYPG